MASTFDTLVLQSYIHYITQQQQHTPSPGQCCNNKKTMTPRIQDEPTEDEGHTLVTARRARKFGNAPPRKVRVGTTPWADVDFDDWKPDVQPLTGSSRLEAIRNMRQLPPQPTCAPPPVPDQKRGDESSIIGESNFGSQQAKDLSASSIG